jgi:predicted nucleic acid-binding protein
MAYLLDTNILIDLADGVDETLVRFEQLSSLALAMSAISAAELEGSIEADPQYREMREVPTRALLQAITILPFTADCTRLLAQMFQARGYNRKHMLDMMIAAQALDSNRTLITRNPKDFIGIPRLQIDAW